VSLSFYRWLTASVIIFPFAFHSFKSEFGLIRKSLPYLFWAALSGIALFNTFVYVGGHYTSAINLALIGTTSSPIIANILARIFLKEKIGWLRVTGIIICISGILFLLSKGNISQLLAFKFSKGDAWILMAGLSFAVYNTLVRKKPAALSPLSFLFTIFCMGTILLFPFYLHELNTEPPVQWNAHLFLVILYLGLGTSVICFWIWNIAIQHLGAGRTALFGNLIPVFSSIEAVIILGEEFGSQHVISMLLVFAGLLIANLPLFLKTRSS